MARVSALRPLAGDPIWVAAIEDLLAAVDTQVPLPRRHLDRPFLLPIESVLTISGRGTVVTGALEQGAIRVGDPVEVIGFGVDGDAPLVSVVTGLETFGQTLPQAQAGDNAAVLLRGIRRHRPQFHVRTADTVGLIDLGPGGVAEPGSTVTAEVTLGVPLPLTSGLGFAVREGGHTVAAGTRHPAAGLTGNTAAATSGGTRAPRPVPPDITPDRALDNPDEVVRVCGVGTTSDGAR